jgi:hypothetical protein
MSIAVKDYLPTVGTKAERIAQIKAELMSVPILEFNGEGVRSATRHWMEFRIPFANGRRIRYEWNPTAETWTALDKSQIMQLSTANSDTVWLESSYNATTSGISNPGQSPSLFKAWSTDGDRGIFVLSDVTNITQLSTSVRGIIFHWFTGQSGEPYFCWGWGGTGWTSTETMHYIAMDRDSWLSSHSAGDSWRSAPPQSHWQDMVNWSNRRFTKDDLSRHDLLMQDNAWAYWETNAASPPGMLREEKLKGKFAFGRQTATPNVSDIFVDQATGKQYVVMTSNSLMEL